MADLTGKHGLIVGVANKRSISWAIAQAAAAAGARLALTYPSERLEENVRELGAKLENALVLPCDGASDEQIATLAASLDREFGGLGFLLDGGAFAPGPERGPLKRNAELAEAADAALFLLGPASRAVTGAIIFADAGFHVTGI